MPINPTEKLKGALEGRDNEIMLHRGLCGNSLIQGAPDVSAEISIKSLPHTNSKIGFIIPGILLSNILGRTSIMELMCYGSETGTGDIPPLFVCSTVYLAEPHVLPCVYGGKVVTFF